jgi:DNA-binding NarL/FixJ family response regulator
MIKVLVADDHAVVRRGLRGILAETPDILVGGEASSSAEVLQLLARERWDVAILDIALKDGSGLDALAQIRRAYPEVACLVLTVYSEDQYAVRALRAGARGFLTKESAPECLVEAVRKVAAGGRWVTPELGEKLAGRLAEGGGPPHERLTDREFDVLRRIASGRTVSQIAAELALSVKTISTYRTRILAKMGMATSAELTAYAVRAGLVT